METNPINSSNSTSGRPLTGVWKYFKRGVFKSDGASHPILRYLDVKCLGQKCNTLLKRLAVEQLEEFNKIIDESICNPINDNQIPKVLDFTLKIIENIIKVDNNKGTEEIVQLPSHIRVPSEEVPTKPQQKRPTITKVLDIYFILDESLEETFACAELDYEEGKIDLELLQNLDESKNPIYNQKAPEKDRANEINPSGPCKSNNEVEKDETNMYNNKVNKNENETNKKDNEIFEVVEKTAKMNHINKTFEFGLKNGIDIKKKPSNYRKPAKMDNKGREALNYVCEVQMRKVKEFQEMVKREKEAKKLTKIELVEVKK
ncbi:hypothetical protein C2G38_2223076 [Gigaspora rosea]|uniref:Uncharacterized protein n=1 Tax=Gigaspora rosea TaxID=44941 RepID=A0A397U3C4_9GLOM|nr:hypothetical protein C2G38_2223076 [Gigaspora rosea]